MTPLAAYYLKQTMLRKGRWFRENAALIRKKFADTHCFEITQCLPIIEELQSLVDKEGVTAS